MKKITALLAAMVLSLGLVSCGGSGSDTIKVGVLAPTSVFFGQMVVEGIQMAIDEVNEQGGILGKKVEAVIINDEDKADVGTLGLTKAIESDKIDVILGGVNSGVVLACMEVMAKYKKLWLGTGGASTKVVQNVKDDYEKYKYYFRVGTIDAALQGNAIGDFVKEFLSKKYNIKKVALIGSDHAYAKAFILAMTKKSLTEAGYEIVYETYLPSGTTDFSAVFAQVKEKGAQLIVEAWPGPDAITFVKQYNDLKVPAILVGAVVEALKDEYGTETGGASVYQAGFSPQSGPAPMTSKTLGFAERYMKKFNKSAGYLAYPSFDTLFILKAAAEKVGSLDTEALIKALEEMEYEGNIWYKFKPENHDLTMGIQDGKVYADFVWFQWQEDKTRKAFYPEAFKQVDYQLAPWIEESFKKQGIIK